MPGSNDTLPGGGGSPLSNPYFRAKPKLSVFENRQFNGHFFFTKNFQQNVKYYGEKVLELFWHSKKNFFQDTFFEKKFKKNFEKLFTLKKIFQIFLNFFSKKVSWKKNFCECQKNFKNFFPITLNTFVWKCLVKKKVSAKLSVFKNGQFWFCPEIRIT